MDDSMVLASYRSPSQLVQDKVIDRIDAHCAGFIALSPFAMLSTASAEGWPEISPRGGGRGFVHVLDEHRLAVPDRTGNNRLDSLRNVVENPRVALQFFIPGFEETLKVFGTTTLVEPGSLDVDLTEFGKPPRSVLVVHVTSAYFHCAKAVMRAGLWDPEAQVDRATFTPFGQVLRDHCALEAELPDDATIRADLAQEL
ncbi:MSMEG_1061 family FMN-dependent PPOX-type flavoprotein [Modestobacter sp. L9-4]|uniref:MSMEG_1061 family FMN-dependent PPOX-type flavoprotein n=1 Tax=Modestobacter sp. L9-4 TaxID=2851567 RepID=UPI001F3472A2|nr:MSMEG_1061 family FMN-dependent PPOX-type flavoprotein [Modestobacter sp. L9-4]